MKNATNTSLTCLESVSSLQAASFKEFCEHPDNRQLLIKHQQKEIRQMHKASETASALKFRDTVLDSEYEAQNNIAPFLENKVLRRIIKTFTNDPKGDFSKWARNPLIIDMLKTAKDVCFPFGVKVSHKNSLTRSWTLSNVAILLKY